MKKKSAEKSNADEAGTESASYVVGQVSGCLFPNKSAAAPGSLSALFSTTSTTNTVKFVPAPKPEPKPVKDEDAPVVTKAVPAKVQSTKSKKPKTAAELKLDDRESSLQNADNDDVTVPKASKASKRKAPKPEDDDEDAIVNKRPAKRVLSFKDRAAERVKLSRTVFVGNLPVGCTREALRSIFKEHGAIESIRFRSVVREDPTMSRKVAAIQRKIHPKKQSINAYIVFKEKEGAVNALTRNGLEIQKDFHIRVDSSVSKQHDHKRSIFVGNLPYDIAELSLRQHFEDCGPVEGVRLIRDRDTGMGKGFGYVLFENPDAVQLALKLDSSKLCERKIRVKRSVKDKDGKSAAAGEDGKGQGRGRKGNMKGMKGGPPGKRFGGGGVGGAGRGGKKPFQRNPGKKTSPSTFKGEMADPAAKKHKGQKKKSKPRKKKDIHL